VALFSALGLFHVSWEDMEDIYTDLKTDSELKNNIENNNNNKNGKQNKIVSSDFNSENDDTQINENKKNGNAINTVNKDEAVSADLGPDSSLILSFSRAAERCLPELSHAETFQVGAVCVVWIDGWVGLRMWCVCIV
jgi:hypothetical protein